MADLVEATAASLVTVQGERPVSGTVVGPEQVLTCAHVLHADDLTVRLPSGVELPATVVGRDPSSDLALLWVAGLTAPALAPTAGVRVGELLLAVGRPRHGVQVALGLMEHAPTGRDAGGGWLSTGAAPFPGVSGGALVDARGNLVGLLNAGLRRGTLLAVPAEQALAAAHQLATTGRVTRAYLGLATQPVHLPPAGETGEPQVQGHRRPDRSDRHEQGYGQNWEHGPRGWGRWRGPGGRRGWPGRLGLTVVKVEPGSPAQDAGLRLGDIILALEGEDIRHPGELMARVRGQVGATLTARILRGGEESDVTLRIGER